MDNFTASNGHSIVRDGEELHIHWGQSECLVTSASTAYHVEALREFFQAEADERLGRWRWPENPDYVVYLYDGCAVVVSESDPNRVPDRVHRRYLEDPAGSLGWGEFAARAYFDAHREPKPWQQAEAGELWELTVEGVTRTYAAIASTGQNGVYVRFFPTHEVAAVTVGTMAPVITGGTRIWPAEVSS